MLASGQRAVVLKKLAVTNQATAYPDYESVYMDVGSQAEFYDCWFYVGSGAIYGLFQEPYSRSFLYRTFIGDSNTGGVFCVGGACDLWQSKLYNATAGNTKIGLRATQLGKVNASRGTIVDNYDGAAGALADQNSVLPLHRLCRRFQHRQELRHIWPKATDGSRMFNNSAVYVTYSGNAITPTSTPHHGLLNDKDTR